MILGGAQATVLEMAERLQRKGLECEIITGPETGPEGHLFDEIRQANIQLHISKSLVRNVHPVKDMLAVFELWWLFKRGGYEIVHTNSSKAGVVGRVAARLAGIPVVVHSVHGYAFNQYQSRFERSVYLCLEQLCGALSHHLLVVSRPLLRRTIRHRIGRPSRVSLVYSGIEIGKYRAQASREQVRALLGVPDSAIVIASVARLVDGKGHHDLLQAFALLHRHRPEVRLVLVGDGPLRRNLEEYSDSLGIRDAVHFLGLRRDVPQLMSAFDIFVLASLWEGMGRVLLEAMAARNAVVATGVGGIVDLIQDGVNGLMTRAQDPQSLFEALLKLVDDPHLRERLGARGSEFVGAEYSIDTTAEAVLALYGKLLQERGHAVPNPEGAAPRKVLRVITRLNVGGPAIHTILLTDRLRPDYDTVLVIGTEARNEGSMIPLADRLGVPVVRVPELRREIDPLHDLVALIKLIGIIRRERPQIVHTHTAKAGFVGRLAAWLCGVPIIIHTFHGHVFRGYFGPRKTKMLLFIERALALVSNQIITVNEEQRAELMGFGIASKQKLISVPLGLELGPLADGPADVHAMRCKWGIPEGVPAVGIVARLVHIKGHELFLAAAAHVHARFPEAYFVIVGDGERRGELEEMARELQIPVVFTGWETDLRAVYGALDVICLTSINEGSPVALIEALAAGKPIVSTNAGGVVDLIKSGENGILINERDPAAFGDAICRLLAEPEQGRAMGAKGKESVFPAYDVSTLVANIDQLYERAISSTRDGHPLAQLLRKPWREDGRCATQPPSRGSEPAASSSR